MTKNPTEPTLSQKITCLFPSYYLWIGRQIWRILTPDSRNLFRLRKQTWNNLERHTSATLFAEQNFIREYFFQWLHIFFWLPYYTITIPNLKVTTYIVFSFLHFSVVKRFQLRFHSSYSRWLIMWYLKTDTPAFHFFSLQGNVILFFVNHLSRQKIRDFCLWPLTKRRNQQDWKSLHSLRDILKKKQAEIVLSRKLGIHMHLNLAFINLIIEQNLPDHILPFVVLGGLFIFVVVVFILRILYINIKPLFCHKKLRAIQI